MSIANKSKFIKRKIIEINEDLCTGCGNCVVSCAEGALEIIDGKAKVINDVFCDGLGACIGECPEGALEIIEREAPEFDEKAVEEHLENQNIIEKKTDLFANEPGNIPCGCPGSQTMSFNKCNDDQEQITEGNISSQLRNWPIQLHLINPTAPYFENVDVLISADCVAFSLGGFHPEYLKGKVLSIACPKLDQAQESYINKITSLIDGSSINTLTVMTMEVTCCSGLVHLVKEGLSRAKRKVPIKSIKVSLQGEILHETWL